MASAEAEVPEAAEPLTSAQLNYFHTFGYLHLKRVFTASDIAMLARRADELVAESTLVAGEFEPRGPAGDVEPYFMEPVIDRPLVLGAVTCDPLSLAASILLTVDTASRALKVQRGGRRQLMASMGEGRFLLKGDSHLHTQRASSDPESEHGWHR